MNSYHGLYMLHPMYCHKQILIDHQQSQLHEKGLKLARFAFLGILLVRCRFQMAFLTTSIFHKGTKMSLIRSFLNLILFARIHLLHLKTLLILITGVEYLQLLVVDSEACGGLGEDHAGQYKVSCLVVS